MGCLKSISRALMPKINSSLCYLTQKNRINCTSHVNAFFIRSNHIFDAGNCVRWNCPRNLHTSVSLQAELNTSGNDRVSSITKEFLAAKAKEDAEQELGLHSDSDEKQKQEETEKKRRSVKYSFIALGGVTVAIGFTLIYRWGAPTTDDDGNLLEDEFTNLPVVEQYLRRTYDQLQTTNTMIQKPSRDQLLPEPLSGQFIQPRYTLVLELKDVLVHPEWTYQNGWRFKKRPGVEVLLQNCAPPMFEIVIYTNEQGFTAYPVIDKLDRNGFIWYRLFKDSTHYIEGKHVKELNNLNRDLKKVIMVDWDGNAVSCKRNQLCVPRWDGNMADKGLMQLASLLKTIADSEVDDVRDVLDFYKQFENPLDKFSELQLEAMELEKKLEEQQRSEASSKAGAQWKPSFIKKWT